MFRIAEIFESIQGEGSLSGTPALFVRFAGCNLACSWCDTNHEEQKALSLEEIEGLIATSSMPLVCFTGGEPLLQADLLGLLIRLEKTEKRMQLETNGTLLYRCGSDRRAPDLVTVSPKCSFDSLEAISVREGIYFQSQYSEIELKLVTWDEGWASPWFEWFLDRNPGANVFLQPRSCGKESTELCIRIVLQRAHPNLRVGLQVHKILGMR